MHHVKVSVNSTISALNCMSTGPKFFIMWFKNQHYKEIIKSIFHNQKLREGYTVKFFFQSISRNTVSGSFHETWNTFMKCFYFSIQHSLRMFLTNKKNVFAEKRYRVKNSKIPKRIWMKPCSKTRSDKSTCANIFLELPLTI